MAAAVFEEPEGETARMRLAGADVVAPPLLWFEMASICVKKLRTYPGETTLLLAAYDYFLAMTVRAEVVDHRAVPLLAHRMGLSAYDASYLWLAGRLNAELVTLDRRLGRAAKDVGLRS